MRTLYGTFFGGWGEDHPQIPDALVHEARRGGETDRGYFVDPYGHGRLQPKVLVVSVRADQGEGQTLLIRRVRAAASGAARFEVRTGRVVTLAQMMFHGLNERCICYDVYKFYMALPIVIHKRHHPETGAASRARRTN